MSVGEGEGEGEGRGGGEGGGIGCRIVCIRNQSISWVVLAPHYSPDVCTSQHSGAYLRRQVVGFEDLVDDSGIHERVGRGGMGRVYCVCAGVCVCVCAGVCVCVCAGVCVHVELIGHNHPIPPVLLADCNGTEWHGRSSFPENDR